MFRDVILDEALKGFCECILVADSNIACYYFPSASIIQIDDRLFTLSKWRNRALLHDLLDVWILKRPILPTNGKRQFAYRSEIRTSGNEGYGRRIGEFRERICYGGLESDWKAIYLRVLCHYRFWVFRLG